LDDNFTPKIADFGVSREKIETTLMTRVGTVSSDQCHLSHLLRVSNYSLCWFLSHVYIEQSIKHFPKVKILIFVFDQLFTDLFHIEYLKTKMCFLCVSYTKTIWESKSNQQSKLFRTRQ
jgi:hypothetical protein